MLLGGIKAPGCLVVSATAQPSHQLQAAKQKQQEKQSQLKGSDVLQAMQRAAAEKSKVRGKSKRKGSAVAKSSHKEEDDEDYGNVRPLMVKSEWRVKLDEFEKRLQHLTQTK